MNTTEVSNSYTPQFDESELKLVEIHKSKYPDPQAALMPVLWMIQDKYGWISLEAMKFAGDLLNVSYEHVIGVATFYTMYNKKMQGKYHLQVCTNVSCMLRGGYEIYRHISDKLGIKNKETTADGKFTLEEVECLGSCATAPMMQVSNKEFFENLTIEKVNDLIESFK